MKKLVGLIAITLISCGAWAQDTKMEKKMETKMDGKMMKDCVMMKDGKMMVSQKGQTMAMDKDMTMSNGTVVMMDGNVKMKDGKTKMLKDEECVYMDGKMGMMKMHDKMDKKMKQ